MSRKHLRAFVESMQGPVQVTVNEFLMESQNEGRALIDELVSIETAVIMTPARLKDLLSTHQERLLEKQVQWMLSHETDESPRKVRRR